MSEQTLKLRELIKRPGCVAAAGAWDAMSAKLAEAAGFEIVDTMGSGFSHTMIGRTDYGYITQTEMIDGVRRVAQAVNVPVIADMDDGFGDALKVRRTVQLCEQAGAAGLHIEDNAMPKRCAWLGECALISKDSMVQKIESAVDARKDPNFVIIARTDKHQDVSLDESIERAIAYAKAGADMVLMINMNAKEARRAAKEVPVPQVGCQVGGVFLYSPSEAVSLGYKIILYPTTLYVAAYFAARDAATKLKKGFEDKKKVPPVGGTLQQVMELEELVGYSEDVRLLEKYYGPACR